MTADKGTPTDLNLDLRVRARLVASGTLDAAAIHAYLTGLPDLDGHAEILAIDQPALGAVHASAHRADFGLSSSDGDEEEGHE